MSNERTHETLAPRFFVFGILCPIFWLVNLLSWWYLQFWQPHELEFQNFQEDEYPGFYERDILKKRSLVHLKKEVLQEIRIIQDLTDSSSEEDYNNDNVDVDGTESSSVKADAEQAEGDEEALEKYRYAFLKKVARDVLATHDSLRKSFRDWALRSLLGLVIDSVLILFIALLCKETSLDRRQNKISPVFLHSLHFPRFTTTCKGSFFFFSLSVSFFLFVYVSGLVIYRKLKILEKQILSKDRSRNEFQS